MTHKVFLNAEGPTEGTSNELKSFLTYVKESKPEDDFTNRLENAVQKARESMEWRMEYMTLNMKLRESYDNGYDTGFDKGQEQSVLSLLKHGMTPNAVAENLELPLEVVVNIATKNEEKDRVAAKLLQ